MYELCARVIPPLFDSYGSVTLFYRIALRRITRQNTYYIILEFYFSLFSHANNQWAFYGVHHL